MLSSSQLQPTQQKFPEGSEGVSGDYRVRNELHSCYDDTVKTKTLLWEKAVKKDGTSHFPHNWTPSYDIQGYIFKDRDVSQPFS